MWRDAVSRRTDALRAEQQLRVDGGVGLQQGATPATTRTTTTEMLREASRCAQESTATGTSTIRQLQMQGEQFDEIHRTLNKVEQELNESDRTLQSMSWTGRVKGWFKSKQNAKTIDTGTDVVTAVSGSASGATASLQQQQQQQPRQQQVGAKSHCLSEEDDKLLDMLSNDVSAMREIAMMQGELLVEHNRRLDEINAKSNAVCGHVERTSSKVKKI